MKTRLDRWLVSQLLEDQGRIGEVTIEKTRVSDHDAVTCQLRIRKHKKNSSFEKVSARVMADEEFGRKVEEL